MNTFKTITIKGYNRKTRVKNIYRAGKKQTKPKVEKNNQRTLEIWMNKKMIVINYYGFVICNNYIEYESNGDRKKTPSIKEYVDKSKPFLKDIINSAKKYETTKTQLTIAINCISLQDNDEKFVMHLKSGNIQIIISDKTDKIIKEHFESLIHTSPNNQLKNQLKVAIPSLIVLICCITNFIKQTRIVMNHLQILQIGSKKGQQ